jgi:hypothetical protein
MASLKNKGSMIALTINGSNCIVSVLENRQDLSVIDLK